jgi:hypothetical protein
VTATGDTDEKYNEPIGLMEKNWRHWSMPGNHDHWSAPLQVLSLCDANSYCRPRFRDMPWADLVPLGDTHAIRIYFMDSDSEVWGSGKKLRRAHGTWARGRFIEQISTTIPVNDPNGVLKRIPPENVVNALVIHHSTSCDAYFCGTKKILSIDSETKKKPEAFWRDMKCSSNSDRTCSRPIFWKGFSIRRVRQLL